MSFASYGTSGPVAPCSGADKVGPMHRGVQAGLPQGLRHQGQEARATSLLRGGAAALCRASDPGQQVSHILLCPFGGTESGWGSAPPLPAEQGLGGGLHSVVPALGLRHCLLRKGGQWAPQTRLTPLSATPAAGGRENPCVRSRPMGAVRSRRPATIPPHPGSGAGRPLPPPGPLAAGWGQGVQL